MVLKKIILFSFLFFLFFLGNTPCSQAQEQIHWLTWEEAALKSKQEKKKIFVHLYTSWCSWCKKMDSSTFENKIVAQYINNNFYPVKFNAETTTSIQFNNKEYKFIKSGKKGYHEFAVWLTHGKLGYPTVVFIDNQLNIIQAIPGFHPVSEFETIMTYFGGNHYKKTPWDIYRKKYKK